jgi:hypothetical protein
MKPRTKIDILEAIANPELFGGFFRDQQTWRAWRSFLAGLFALPMDPDQLELFKEFTGRTTQPTAELNEAYLICGRRGGKSAILAVTAVYLACFRDYRQYLAPGEIATCRIMAADRDQARVIFRYVGALLRENPMLARRIDKAICAATPMPEQQQKNWRLKQACHGNRTFPRRKKLATQRDVLRGELAGFCKLPNLEEPISRTDFRLLRLGCRLS